MSSDKTKEYVCIACPIGCPLRLVHEGDEIKEVEGQKCNRGAKYAKQEFTDPRRTFSTTIPIEGALHSRLPVKLTGPVPKEKIMAAAHEIHKLRVKAPVKLGDVLLVSLLDEEGVDVVACRTMKRV